MSHHPLTSVHIALALAFAVAAAGCGPESAQSLLAKGQAELAKKDARSAVVHFKGALQVDPSATATRVLLGRALAEAGDPLGAIVELTKALELQADPSDVMPTLARAFLESGQYKKLLDAHSGVNLPKNDAQAAFKAYLASAWSLAGDRQKTDAAIAASLTAVPNYPEALIVQVRSMLNRKELDGALAVVEQVLARDPGRPQAWQLKGEILVAKKTDLPGAEAAFRKAIEIDGKFVPAYASLVVSRIRVGDMAGGKKQLGLMQAVAPGNAETKFLQAQVAFLEKDYVKAREGVQQVLRFAPENPNLLLLGAAVEWSSGSLVIAQKMLETAVRVEPTLEAARINLAYINIRLGQAARALAVLEPLLKGESAKAAALSAAGEASLQLGQPALAGGYFSRAVALVPEDPRARTALAMAQLAQGEATAAFIQLESLAVESKDGYADAAVASARLGRGEFDAALAAVDNMIRKNPANASAYELRGRVLAGKGDLVGARQAFEKVLSIEPRFLAVVVALAELDVREAKSDQAKTRYEELLKSDPRNHQVITALADLRLKAGVPAKEVEASLAEAIRLAPDEPAPRLKLVELLFNQRQVKRALVVAQEAATTLPNDVQVLDALGRMLWADGNSQQALATFRRIIAIDAALPVAHIRVADVHRADGNLSAAVASLRRAVEIDPRQREARSALVELLVQAKRPKEALDIAKELQSREPKLAAGYQLEAVVYRKLLNHEASVAAYRRGLQAVGEAGETGDIPMNLFVSLLASKNWKQAEAFALQWLSKHPGDGALIYNLGEGYMINNDFKSAENYFAKAVLLRPDFVPALNNLASMLVQQGKPGAVEPAQRAVSLAPNDPATLDTLAGALMAEGRLPEAVQAQQKAVSVAPADPLIRLNLAKIALRAGNKALARTELDQLVAMGSRNPQREEALRLLKTL